MSAAEIIAELPKLRDEERAAIAQKLRELEDADSMQFLHEAADQMFQEMDKAETKDANRPAR